MIPSLILRTATRLLIPLMLLFALFLLERGHNAPGGGFVGGLMAASAFALYAFARGERRSAEALRVAPRTLLGVGLACAFGAGLLALFAGKAFLTSLWLYVPLPLLAEPYKLGTTLLFDVGVFLVVVGTVLLMIFSVEERGDMLTEEL